MTTDRNDLRPLKALERLKALRRHSRFIADPLFIQEVEALSQDLEEWGVAVEERERRNQELIAYSRRFGEETKRYQRMMDGLEEGVLLTDRDGMVLSANRAVLNLLGKTRKGLIGKPLASLAVEIDRQRFLDLFQRWLKEEDRPDQSWEIQFRSGKERRTSTLIKPSVLRDHKKEITGLSMIIEDSMRKKGIEAEREAFIEILRIIYSADNKRDLMKLIIFYLQQWSGCQAVGIRLKEGDDFPYYETSGFTKAFLLTETRLCAYDQDQTLIRDHKGNPVLECMCGNILSGRFDPSLPFFTSFGSFWTNSTSDLLASTNEADRQARTRNRCHGEGFESVALVPLNFKGNIAGLLQFNDHRRDRFTPERVVFFERLAQSIAIALAQRKAEENLLEKEEKFHSFFDQSNDAVLVARPDGTVLAANPEACRIFDRREEEIRRIGRQGLIDETDPLSIKALKERKHKGRYRGELNFIRKDGTKFPGEISSAIFKNKNGLELTTMIIRDITERKKDQGRLLASLKEKEVLLQEIHHRVKNNLQVISSLLSLQAYRLGDQSLRALYLDSQNRIKSMALVHEQLYQSPDLSTIDFAEYLRKLTAILFRSVEPNFSNIRLQIKANDILLPVAKAVPCGLMVNELVTNALKHAFPHNRKGMIGIEMIVTGGRFKLVIQDNGVGLPEEVNPARTDSLGLQIVQVLIKQLNGELEIDRRVGTTITIHFPK